MGAQVLEVSLLGMGTVLRFAWDGWSMVKQLSYGLQQLRTTLSWKSSCTSGLPADEAALRRGVRFKPPKRRTRLSSSDFGHLFPTIPSLLKKTNLDINLHQEFLFESLLVAIPHPTRPLSSTHFPITSPPPFTTLQTTHIQIAEEHTSSTSGFVW